MPETTKKISVVVPLYNEKDSLEELYKRIKDSIENMGNSFELILIDDGSTDGSSKIVAEICEKDSRVKSIRFSVNSGKADALQAGFEAADDDYIITMDADLQDDPAEIPALIDALEKGLDMVSGWKKE